MPDCDEEDRDDEIGIKRNRPQTYELEDDIKKFIEEVKGLTRYS